MTSQGPNGMSSRENSSNQQPWNYTALLSCNGKLELDFRPKPRSEQYSFSEAAERDKDESEKKRDEKRTRMDEDLAGLDPITVEKSYPVKRIPTLLSPESDQPSR